jgi:hypothetical protein
LKFEIDFAKSDAKRRLRPHLRLDPSGLLEKSRADFEEAMRADPARGGQSSFVRTDRRAGS